MVPHHAYMADSIKFRLKGNFFLPEAEFSGYNFFLAEAKELFFQI
jgi:hypothetical protein